MLLIQGNHGTSTALEQSAGNMSPVLMDVEPVVGSPESLPGSRMELDPEDPLCGEGSGGGTTQ